MSTGERARSGSVMVLRRLALCGVAIVMTCCVTFGASVFVQMVLPSGYATWQDKVSTSLRAVGLGSALDRFENWLYTRSIPPDLPPDLNSLSINGSDPARAGALLPYTGLPHLAHTADGAGWHEVVRVSGEQPSVFTAVIQPDPLHRSIVVGVALIRSSAVEAHLQPGTIQPVASGSAGQIPAKQLPHVVAAFNSGFKMSEFSGGFFLDGETVRPLQRGKAAAVIDDHGRLSIGQWGRDVAMSPRVRAVRQNLALIVENGEPAPGMDRNTDLRWGSAHNQLQYTWRSAIGVTSGGDVVYVAGDKLNLATLGVALAQAGAATGMELDIHTGMQYFSVWCSDGSGDVQPKPLMGTMVGPPERYVQPDERDFFYFTKP